jgi:hypothetical protein
MPYVIENGVYSNACYKYFACTHHANGLPMKNHKSGTNSSETQWNRGTVLFVSESNHWIWR